MRKIFISLVWMLSCLAAFAQNWEGVKADSSYIWGEGWGSTIEEADQQAFVFANQQDYHRRCE